MPTALRSVTKRPRGRRWIAQVLVLFSVTLAILAFTLVPLTESSMRLNARQVFESSRWNALQLQLQSYRLMNYLSDMSQSDFPLNGTAYFQYDLVLSRVDLLREGEIGNHIRGFANGRATRLLNIIAGELELISLNLEHLENGQIQQAPIIVDRLRALDSQITDFVVIVNQGANTYVSTQRDKLDLQLVQLERIAIGLIIVAIILALLAFQISNDIRSVFSRNQRLEESIRDLQKEKGEVITRIIGELKPNIITMTGSCSSALHSDLEQEKNDQLMRISDLSDQMLTQIDSYYDLTLIESGNFDIQISKSVLRQQIEHTLSSLNQLYLTHNVRLFCLLDPRLPTTFEADFKRLHEVLSILISQLAPYCSNGSMLIRVRPSALPILESDQAHLLKATRMVQISIKDKGLGLPVSIQEGLRSNPFNPGNSVTNQIHKMGIGFTFCQYLITSLDGELHFSSSSDNGTEMWVDLPMAPESTSNPVYMNSSNIKIALLEASQLLDESSEIELGDQLYTFEALPETALYRTELSRYRAILLPNLNLIDSSTVLALNDYAEHGASLLATQEIVERYPQLNVSGILTFPVTQSQLEQLLDIQE